MKKQGLFGAMALFMGLILLSSCNKMSFSPTQAKLDNSSFDVPPTLDPLPNVTLPDPLKKTGACADKQSVTSCLSCNVPVNPPAQPAISTKAQKLAQIMAMSCQIYNKSYPTPYTAPTVEQIRSHILACTPALYPETPMTSAQTALINSLLDPSNDSLRQRLFKGLWYQPPLTDDFALYFGLENKEAAYAFCMDRPIYGYLFTQEYATAITTKRLEEWQSNLEAQARWNAAQALRAQLFSCLNKPGGVVTPDPTLPPPPVHSCDYKSFEGYYELGGRDEVATYLAQGYKVAVETGLSCTQLTVVPDVGAFSGKLKIAGVKCQ